MTEHDLMRALLFRINYHSHALVCPHLYLERDLIYRRQTREIDLAVVTRAGYLWEFEIKCSLADLLRQRDKTGLMASHAAVSRFWFVVPEQATPAALDGWPQAGVIDYTVLGRCHWSHHQDGDRSLLDLTVKRRPALLCRRPLSPALRDDIRRKISIRYCDALLSSPALLADTR
jgi:hypothetical protein